MTNDGKNLRAEDERAAGETGRELYRKLQEGVEQADKPAASESAEKQEAAPAPAAKAPAPAVARPADVAAARAVDGPQDDARRAAALSLVAAPLLSLVAFGVMVFGLQAVEATWQAVVLYSLTAAAIVALTCAFGSAVMASGLGPRCMRRACSAWLRGFLLAGVACVVVSMVFGFVFLLLFL